MCLQQLARKNYLVENKKGFHIHLKINWETGMNRNHEFFFVPTFIVFIAFAFFENTLCANRRTSQTAKL